MEYLKRFLWVLQLIIMVPIHILVFFFIVIPVVLFAQAFEIVFVLAIYYIVTGDFYWDEYKSISTAINEFLFSGEKFKIKRY